MTKIGNLEVHPDAELMPAMSVDEFKSLKEDIRCNGLLEPVVLDRDGRLIDGRHRARAVEELRVEALDAGARPVELETVLWDDRGGDVLGFVIAKNIERRHLSDNARARLVTRPEIRARFEQIARQRQEEGRRLGGENTRRRAKGLPRKDARNLPSAEWAAEAAKVGAVSKRSVQLSAALDRAAGEGVLIESGKKGEERRTPLSPEVREKARELAALADADRITASRGLREVKRAAQVEKVKACRPPAGRFGVIVADPAWKYGARTDDDSHRGRVDYPTDELEAICRGKVGDVECVDKERGCLRFAADDCILFLWVTNAFLADGSASRVVAAWGFAAKTIWTWVKRARDGSVKFGVGNWGRNATEHVIVATRGRPLVSFGDVPTVIDAPPREPSRKPDEFYDAVEAGCTSAARLELFSREPRPGWVGSGAESDLFESAPSSARGGRLR